MQRAVLWIVVVVALLASVKASAQTTPKTFTLEESYQLALETSERLKRSAEDIKIAEAQYRQALSYVYPQLSIGAAQVFRDNSNYGRVVQNGGSSEDGNSPSGGTSGSLGKSQFEGTVLISQQLFNGFRDFIIADALQQETAAVSFELKRNREVLYQDVAQLFYQVRRSADELRVLDSIEKTLSDRVSELRRFIELGKSRESELLAAQSELQDLLAIKEQTKGVLSATKELLAFLIGVPAEEWELVDGAGALQLQPLDDYLQRTGERSDLKAAELRASAQSERVRAAERAYWPQLEVLGNSYPIEDPNRNRDWDVIFSMTMPIFDGGLIDAQTDEQRALQRNAELAAQEKRRVIDREVRANYARAAAGEKELASLEKLLVAARKSYESQKRDYEFGVVSNLEVLQSIQSMQDAQRKLVATRYGLAITLVDLEVAVGGISP